MFNRVFIQRTDPQYGGAEAFKTAFSFYVRDIADKETETGFGTQKLLETLGAIIVADTEYATMYIELPEERFAAKRDDLQRSIGLIARYAAEKSNDILSRRLFGVNTQKEYWGRRLDKTVRTLEIMQKDEIPNRFVLETELLSSAEYCGDQNEVTIIVQNHMPWWPISSQEERYVDDISRSKGLPVWDYDITERWNDLDRYRQELSE